MESTGPTVSVALAAYNGARFLREQLESIARQTLQPVEIVVADDASTDDTVAVVELFAAGARVPVCLLEAEHRRGPSRNFEHAIRACAGEFIALADQDDVWLPDKLAMLTGALRSHPRAAYAFSNATLIDEHGRDLGGKPLLDRRFARGSIARAFAANRELDLLLKRDFVYGTTLVFRSSLRDLVLPVGGHWSHDSWIVNVCALFGHSGVPVLESLVRYRQHPSQASGGTGDPKRIGYAERVAALEELRAALQDRQGEHRLRPDALPRIDDKLRFLRALRGAERAPLPARARIAAREVVSGRWLRYSPRTFLVDKRIDPGWFLRRR